MSSSSTFSLIFSGSISSELTGAFKRLRNAGKGLNDQLGDLNKASRDIGQLRRATAQMDKFKDQMALGGKNAEALKNNLAGVGKRVREAEKEYQGLEKRLKKIDRQRRRSRVSGRRSIDERTDVRLMKERARVAARMERSQAKNDQLRTERRELQDRLAAGKDKAAEKYSRQAAKVRELSEALRQAGHNAGRLDQAEKRIAKSMSAANQRLHHQNRAAHYRDMRQNAFGVGYGVVAAGAAAAVPVKLALDYKDQLAEATKTFDTITSDKQAWEFGIKNLRQSIVTPMVSHAELLEISGTGGKLGISEKDIADFRQKVAMAKVTWDMGAEESAESMSKISNTFRIPMNNLTDIMDLINHFGNTYKAQERDIADALGRAAGTFGTVGLNEFEAAAAVNTMIHLGKQSEVAARMFNTTLVKLQTISQQPNRAVLAFEKLGWKAEDFEQMWDKDAQGTYLEFLRRLAAKSKLERSKILSPLMGAEWTDDYLLLVNGLADYEQALKTAGDRKQWVGAVTREYVKRIDTEKSALGLLKKQVSAIGIVTGAVALPTIKEFAKTTSEGLVKVFDYAEKNPEKIKNILGTGAAVLGGVAGWKALAGSTKLVSGSLGEMYHTLKSISALNVLKGKWLGLGAVGALAYAAHELGMLEPMAKGFTEELKKGTKPILEEFNQAYVGWQKILGKANIKELTDWESVGTLIGETAGKTMAESFGFYVNFAKYLGGVAGSASVGDWAEVRKQTVDPIIYGAMGTWDYIQEKTGKKDSDKSGGELLWNWATKKTNLEDTKFVKFFEQPTNEVFEQLFSNNALKSYWNSFDRMSHDLFSDAGEYWGKKIADTYEFLKQRDREMGEAARAQGVKLMSFMPPPEPENKETAKPEQPAQPKQPKPPKIDIKIYDELIDKTKKLKENVHDIFGDTSKAATNWSGDIVGVFDDMVSKTSGFHKKISGELDAVAGSFNDFKSKMRSISSEIAGYFKSIGSSISGSITNELSAGTSAANELVNAIKRIEDAAVRARDIKFRSFIPKESELQKPKFFDDFIEESNRFENNISGIFDITGKSAGQWAGNISTGLDKTEGRFNEFNTDINAITNEISRDFRSIGSSISGSITSELNSATAAANNLATALDKVKNAPKLDPKKYVFDENQEKLFKGISTSKKTYDRFAEHDMDFYSVQATGKLYQKARASGGPIHPGESYLVGEKGPELIFPSRPGWVADHRQTAGIFGGLFRALFGGLGALRMPALSFGLPGGSLSGMLLDGVLGRIRPHPAIEKFLGSNSKITNISKNESGGMTLHINVHLPPGMTNVDQVREAAERGVAQSVAEFERRFQEMTHQQQRTAFGY